MQADSSMAAWWGRQFDRIYCFHHTGMKGRYEAMRSLIANFAVLLSQLKDAGVIGDYGAQT